ncbi:MAG: prepilin-type N-terminal cleavage/methylation domain-containing protein [Pseudomonadota bacterium]
MHMRNRGFTLIEIAIVLVIIGLLLGGILKGQELINSAKVKNLAADFKGIPVFIYGYQDKFKALPGDDAAAATHMNGATNATTGGTVGNGMIEGAWNSNTTTEESYLFWQHVRLAGLAPGSTTIGGADYVPRNADGGRIGIQSSTGFTTITQNAAGAAAPMTGSYIICSDAILGKFVKQLDTTMDNGDTDTGSMRVADPANAGRSIATANVTDGQAYTVCMGF